MNPFGIDLQFSLPEIADTGSGPTRQGEGANGEDDFLSQFLEMLFAESRTEADLPELPNPDLKGEEGVEGAPEEIGVPEAEVLLPAESTAIPKEPVAEEARPVSRKFEQVVVDDFLPGEPISAVAISEEIPSAGAAAGGQEGQPAAKSGEGKPETPAQEGRPATESEEIPFGQNPRFRMNLAEQLDLDTAAGRPADSVPRQRMSPFTEFTLVDRGQPAPSADVDIEGSERNDLPPRVDSPVKKGGKTGTRDKLPFEASSYKTIEPVRPQPESPEGSKFSVDGQRPGNEPVRAEAPEPARPAVPNPLIFDGQKTAAPESYKVAHSWGFDAVEMERRFIRPFSPHLEKISSRIRTKTELVDQSRVDGLDERPTKTFVSQVNGERTIPEAVSRPAEGRNTDRLPAELEKLAPEVAKASSPDPVDRPEILGGTRAGSSVLLPGQKVDIAEGIQARPFAPLLQAESFDRIVDQIIKQVSLRQQGETFQLGVRLKPEFLGEVRIETLMDKEHGIRAVIQAENAVVRGLLEGRLATLEQHFRDMGLQIETVQIGTIPADAESGSGTNDGGQASQNMPGEELGETDSPVSEETSEPKEIDIDDGHIHVYI